MLPQSFIVIPVKFLKLSGTVQCSRFIKTQCLGSIGMDHVISESCYKGTILKGNIVVKELGF